MRIRIITDSKNVIPPFSCSRQFGAKRGGRTVQGQLPFSYRSTLPLRHKMCSAEQKQSKCTTALQIASMSSRLSLRPAAGNVREGCNPRRRAVANIDLKTACTLKVGQAFTRDRSILTGFGNSESERATFIANRARVVHRKVRREAFTSFSVLLC